MEQLFIDQYKPNKILYNRSWSSKTGILRGDKHHFYGKSPSEWMSEEANRRRIEKLRGRTGEKNPFYNRKHTPEVIQYLRKNARIMVKRMVCLKRIILKSTNG